MSRKERAFGFGFILLSVLLGVFIVFKSGAAGSVTINDNATGTGTGQWQYSGTGWTHYTGSSFKYLGDDHSSSVAGDTATLRFSGTKVAYYGAKSPQAGIIAVSIDDGAETRIDLYSAIRHDNTLIFSSPILAAGEHTLRIRLTGEKNAAATDDAAAVDRAVVSTGGPSADLNGDGKVDITDLSTLLSRWGSADAGADLNGSGSVDITDLSVLLSRWGEAPAPAPEPTPEPTPAPAPAPGHATVMDEPFSTNETVSWSNNTHPNLWIQWHGLNPVAIGGGTAKLTGNSHANSYNGYWRAVSRKRYGGAGKSTIIKTRVRATTLYTDRYNGVYSGVKLGLKFPAEQSVTGYSKDDPRSALGGAGGKNPASIIAVMGVGPQGLMEVARRPYGDNGYLPFPAPKRIGYTAGQWRNATIRIDQTPGPKLRVRIWHTPDHSMSAAPLYDFTGAGVSDDKGFLWYRTDFADFEFDYIQVEEQPA